MVSAGDVGQKDRDDTVFLTGRVELPTWWLMRPRERHTWEDSGQI